MTNDRDGDSTGVGGQRSRVPGAGVAQWGGTVLTTIADKTGHREARIVRYHDGMYGFEEWHLLHEEVADLDYWAPVTARGRTITDSPESAECEARTNIDWLIGDVP